MKGASNVCRQASAGLARELHAVAAAEFVDTTTGVQNFLLTGVKGMTSGTDIDTQSIRPERRTRLETVTTAASHGDFFVLRMNVGFHVGYASVAL